VTDYGRGASVGASVNRPSGADMEFLQAATHPLIRRRTVLQAGPRTRRWAPAGAALLALFVAVAVLEGSSTGRSAAPPAHAGLAPRAAFSSLPRALRALASGSLAATAPSFDVSAAGGAFTAQNAGQGLRARFDRAGVEVVSGGTRVGLRLRAAGYGSSLRPLAAVSPLARANRVSYARAGLTEWYANGPHGLEQGFTLPRAPAGRAASTLTLSLALSGTAHPALAADGRSVLFGRAGAASLRYGGLLASDARGRALPGRLRLSAAGLLLQIDTRGARYPVRVDPLLQQGSKLTAHEEIGKAGFGDGVALSADGRTALISGPADNGETGAVWVFARSGSTWTEQAKLVAAKGEEAGKGRFGNAVALSGDGNTALISTASEGVLGSAWVFTRSGATWTQQGARLKPTGEVGNARFGGSVALSGDGNTALIGGAGDNGEIGAAWVFARSGGAWAQQGNKLLAGAGEEVGKGSFGAAAALSGDGNTALVGALNDNTRVGAAFVFTRSGATWSQQGSKLIPEAGEVSGFFGDSVALSGDGSTALVGEEGEKSFTGSASVFVRSGSTWTQQGAKLAPKAGEEVGGAFFAERVALSGDGNTALIGARDDNNEIGAAWQFARSGPTWTEQGAKLVAANGEESSEGDFGNDLAISVDGATALIGGPSDNGEVGAAWVFVNPPTVSTAAAAAITSRAATLTGSVGPDAPSGAYFQYGTTGAYGSSTAAQSVTVSTAATALSALAAGLAPATTYHFRAVAENSGGVAYGADRTFTTLAAAAPTPLITAASESHRVWREGSRLAAYARAKRPPLGTSFSVSLNEAASVTLSFSERAGGRRLGRRCLAPTPRNRRRPACKRMITAGTLTFAARAGLNRISFQGRISAHKRLALGSHTLLISADASGQRSATKSLAFTIVR